MMYNYPNYDQNDYMSPEEDVGYSITNNSISGQTLVNSYDGFIRGNMFNELYSPYLSSEPFKLAPKDEKDALLNKIRECNFAALDIGLYLDTHPNDAEKIKAFTQCESKAKELTNEYESKYGPLTLNSDVLNSYPWAWLAPSWPWEVK